MSDTVTFTVDAKHAPAIQAFVQINSMMNTTATKAEQLGQKFGKAGDDGGKSWDKGLQILNSYPAALLKMVTGTGAVLAITTQLRNEYERMAEIRTKAMGYFDQVREPAQRAELSFEPGFASTPLYQKSVTEMIRKGGNAAGVLDLLGNMASARGRVSQEDTLKAADLVSELMGKQGLNAEDSRDLGGALLDAMNAELDRGGQPDPREIMGSFISSFGASRSTRMGEFARYDMRFINTAMRSFGFSRPDAVGLQSAVGGAIPDPSGRRTSTANMLLLQKLGEAYRTVDFYGGGVEGVTPDEFEKSGMKMIETAASDTVTGRHLRNYLFGINADAKDYDAGLTTMYGGNPTFGGHYQGEAGAFPIVKNMLTPGGGGILERARKAASTVRAGDAARAVTDDVLNGPLTSEQQKLFASRAAQKGAAEAARFQNTLQAQRGSLAEFVQDLGDVAGTYDLQQKWRNIAGNLKSSGLTGEELRQREVEAAKAFIDDILNSEGKGDRGGLFDWVNPLKFSSILGHQQDEYEQWYNEKFPGMLPNDTLGRMTSKLLGPPVTPELNRQFRMERVMSEQQLLQIDALQKFIDQSEQNRQRGLKIDIGVEDKTGRPMSRATSRSTGVELLND